MTEIKPRNHEVTTRHPLLTAEGTLMEPGWSRQLVQTYDRKAIKAPKFRIKEWDYYLVLNEDFAGAFTLSDDGYIGLQSVSLLNLKEGWEHTETILNPLPMGRFHMPSSSEEGTIRYKDDRLMMTFFKGANKRGIACRFENFWEGRAFACKIELEQPPMDTRLDEVRREGVCVQSGDGFRDARLGARRLDVRQPLVLGIGQRDRGREAVRVQHRVRVRRHERRVREHAVL